MKRILIMNGPNLNLLGKRDTEIYGGLDFKTYLEQLRERYPNERIDYFQSNMEGALIDKLHEAGFGKCDGIILNAGAYTHTSIAIYDAIKAITTPVVEVHISNIWNREDFRHNSRIAKACKGVVVGFGLDSYRVALEGLLG